MYVRCLLNSLSSHARTQSPPKAAAPTGQSPDMRADDDAPAAWATLEADSRSDIMMGPEAW
jgi:uncharacterized protein YbjT (DUF2867 family)